MRITLNITVSGDKYDWRRRTENEIALETDAPRPETLPWAAICAGAVEAAISDFRATLEAGDDDN